MAEAPLSKPVPPGEPPNAEEIIRAHAPKIYNLARRMLGSDSDAEDVTQDVLLTVFRKLPTFRGDAALGTWLYRVTVNAALSFRAKRARRAEREVHDPFPAWGGDGLFQTPVRSWSLPPDIELMNQETQVLIEDAIKELPEMYRDVYVLADVEGLPNADIAELLGLSVPAVKSRLHRARLLMRQALAAHFEEMPA